MLKYGRYRWPSTDILPIDEFCRGTSLLGGRDNLAARGHLRGQQENKDEAERQHRRGSPQTGRQAAILGREARHHDAEQAPGGIGRVIEADVLGRFLRAGIGEDQ
jgi:hypothetical protein